MAQAAFSAVMLAAVAADVSLGSLLEVLALAFGTGAGVGIGVRLALLQRLRQVVAEAPAPATEPDTPPVWQDASPTEWLPQTSTTASSGVTASAVLLFATAVGFALVGFFCGSLSGFVVLVVLQGVRFLAMGVAFGIANLITGLVAGVIAGYLVEAFGRRWQMIADELQGVSQRTVLIALAAGGVMGLLLGLLDTFGLGGTLLCVIGVAVVSVAVSLAVLRAWSVPAIPAPTSDEE